MKFFRPKASAISDEGRPTWSPREKKNKEKVEGFGSERPEKNSVLYL